MSWDLKCLPLFTSVWLFFWGLKCLPSFMDVWLFSWGLKCLPPFVGVWLFSCFGTLFHMSYPVTVAEVLSINSSHVIMKHSGRSQIKSDRSSLLSFSIIKQLTLGPFPKL